MRRTGVLRRTTVVFCALTLSVLEVAAGGANDGSPRGASRASSSSRGLILGAEPRAVTMSPDGAARVIVSVRYERGFTSTATRLSVRGLPAGVDASFSPQPVTHQGKSVLALEGDGDVDVGTYALSLGATGSNRTVTRRLTLHVSDEPRFALEVFPSMQSVARGGVARYPVSIEAHSGFDGPVTLVARGLPAGVGASFRPNPVSPGSQSILSVQRDGAPLGRHPFEVLGTSGIVSARDGATLRAAAGGRSWRMRAIARIGAPINTILVGPGRDDGVRRVYAGTVSTGRVFEVSKTGSGWSDPVDIGGSPNGQEIHNMGMGPGRDDGVTRIYACSTGGDLIELTYEGPGWSEQTIGPRRGECYHALVGKGRNDGVNRVYAARGDTVFEYTRRDGGWNEVMVGQVGGVAHGIALGKARGSKTRVYVASTENGTYEATFSSGSWNMARLGDDGDTRNVSVGRGRRGGKRRVYSATSQGGIRELTWSNGDWSAQMIDDVGSITIHAWVAPGRNDGVKRVYTATADGSAFEFSWTGSGWRTRRMGRAENYLYGMHFGKIGRKLRVFGGSFDGNVYQFRWR